MGLEAATKALLDAGKPRDPSWSRKSLYQRFTPGITYDAIETAFVGYCYGDSTSGQVRACVHIHASHESFLDL